MNLRSSSSLLIVALLATCCAWPSPAQPQDARTIFKCVDANGDVTYQDHSCKPGSRETRQDVLVPPPAAPTPVPFEKLPSASSDAALPIPPPAPAPPERPKVPAVWLCTRADDGSHYVSRDGPAPSRWVPAGILGVPQKSLAQSYGPGGGAGVSAPGVNKPKATHGRPDKLAGDYVEVEDECLAATDQQACEYLQGELDIVEKKLRRAFKDERAVLEPKETQLQRDLEGC